MKIAFTHRGFAFVEASSGRLDDRAVFIFYAMLSNRVEYYRLEWVALASKGSPTDAHCAAFDQLRPHIAQMTTTYGSSVVAVDGLPWELHAIEGTTARDIAIAAYFDSQL